MKRILTVFLLIISTLLLTSCGEDFSHCELSLPLSSDYRRVDGGKGFDAVFTNGEAIAGMIRISFIAGFNQGIQETMSSYEFAEFWKNKIGRDAKVMTDIKTPYYTYREDGYFYLCGFYRTPDAYFVVLLSCGSEFEDGYTENFKEILDGAKIIY